MDIFVGTKLFEVILNKGELVISSKLEIISQASLTENKPSRLRSQI